MAQRRMFSLKIVDTDAFLDMGQGSQLLYFHLSMRADDDGFVSNPKKIMRTISAQDDDLKVLFAKRFVLPFESGVCVIKHWKIHNYIQNDRYIATTYTDEKKQLETKENGAYTLKKGEEIDNVSKMDTQVRLELGKDRLENTAATSAAGKEVNEVIFLFKEVNPGIEKYYGNKTQRAAVSRMLKEHGREKLETMIKVLPQVNSQKYWPKSTTPLQFENNLPIYKAKNDELKINSKIGIVNI